MRCASPRTPPSVAIIALLLAAATAINLKRLLNAHAARADAQARDRITDYPTITSLLDLLTRCLAEIDRLAPTDSSTGS